VSFNTQFGTGALYYDSFFFAWDVSDQIGENHPAYCFFDIIQNKKQI
jgi:hypothetical protein